MRSRVAAQGLRPASADFWVQALEAELVEGVDDLPDVRLVGLADAGDLRHGRVDDRGHQDLRTLAHGLAARLPKARQVLHLGCFERPNKQRRPGHSITSVAHIVIDQPLSPEALIPVNTSRTVH